MAAKKRTVKELNELMENLVDKIKHLEEKVQNISLLEEKIKQLEGKISGKENDNFKTQGLEKNIKCSKCDLRFETKKLLRDHIKVNHLREIKCNDCDNTFDEHWKLEKHLGQVHGREKTFHCQLCDEKFYTNWRLKKHERNHDEPNEKFCHYFNNYKKCPYKEFGCKFKHAESEQCKYQNRCKNKLCQFRHLKDQSTLRCKELNWEGKSCEYQTRYEVRMKNHMLGEHGIGEKFNCDYCDYQVADRSLLRKHLEKDHQSKYEQCGGNCSDRLYEENTFKCRNCESILCKVCSQSDNDELCWGCENLLSD